MLGKPSQRTEQRLREHGTRAEAEVTAISDHGLAITNGAEGVVSNTTIMRRTTLRVEPTDQPAFEVEKRFRYSQFSVPRVGDRLAVIFDADDHDTLMIDRDTVILKPAPAGAKFDMSGTVIDRTTEPAAGGAAEVAPGEADPLDRLDHLVKLRDAGALTDAEFAAEKAKILGGTG